MTYTYSTALTQRLDADVVVVGSGSAGASAAIAASREGASVIIIERYGFMGGISTQVLDTFYGFYTPGDHPRKVVGGIPDVVVEKLQARGKAFLRPNTYGAGQGVTYDPETLKLVWESIAVESDVRILYHTSVIDVAVENDEVTAVVAALPAGGSYVSTPESSSTHRATPWLRLTPAHRSKVPRKHPSNRSLRRFG